MSNSETIPSVPVVATFIVDYLRERQLTVRCTVAELKAAVHDRWSVSTTDARTSLELALYSALDSVVERGQVVQSTQTISEAELQELGRHFGTPPGREVLMQSGPARQVQVFQIAPVPVTPGQQLVWEALHGRALTAKELVNVLGDEKRTVTSEGVIRQHVASLRKAGYAIENRPGVGYYRPDAPPSDLQSE